MGLANIRDRLAQAYGTSHLFEIRSPADGGFTVIIEIPFEREGEEEAATLVPPPELTTHPSLREDGMQFGHEPGKQDAVPPVDQSAYPRALG